ncbi:MAG: DUF1543 domain-containing protein [Bacteroidota bacterium]|nr:DUF1543 domain-containing protein [Bacteroidota bacterium]
MILIGCKPEGRHTEQHDIFFGIANELRDLIPEMIAFWPETNGKLHLDGWKAVTQVDGQSVQIITKDESFSRASKLKLFFINLGGYKKDEFEEFHYKLLIAAPDKSVAIQKAKETAFYKHTGFAGATSHIDDKYGVDVDDVYEIEDILPDTAKEKYSIVLAASDSIANDELHLGYFKLDKL